VRESRSRCARTWPTCSSARIARTEGTRAAASCSAKTSAACCCSGSASFSHAVALPADVWEFVGRHRSNRCDAEDVTEETDGDHRT